MGYVEADYARDLDERRSTTSYVFTLGGGPICWKSMVQSLVALSIIESEYMGVAKTAKEALWFVGLVKELGIQQGGVQLHCDSQMPFFLQRNRCIMQGSNTDVRYHKIKELVLVSYCLRRSILLRMQQTC